MRSLDESITGTQRSSDEASRSIRQAGRGSIARARAKSATKSPPNSLRHERAAFETGEELVSWTAEQDGQDTQDRNGKVVEQPPGDQKCMLLFPLGHGVERFPRQNLDVVEGSPG